MEQVSAIEADDVRFAVAVAARAALDSSAMQPSIPKMFRLCILFSLLLFLPSSGLKTAYAGGSP